LLKVKVALLSATNIPLLATLIVLGSTGFIVTGTIQANGDDEDDRRVVNLTITPLETKTCFDALLAQTETLLELNALASDTSGQLRHLRDRARNQASDAHKMIDETALRAQFDAAAAKIAPALAAARQQVLNAADLTKCHDGDPNTTVTLNVTALRATYDGILAAFGLQMSTVLADAQTAFDQLVATAQPRPKKNDDEDKDDEDDDD
jgi:hypothetical protein